MKLCVIARALHPNKGRNPRSAVANITAVELVADTTPVFGLPMTTTVVIYNGVTYPLKGIRADGLSPEQGIVSLLIGLENDSEGVGERCMELFTDQPWGNGTPCAAIRALVKTLVEKKMRPRRW
ncbi:MAG: hypothetical protein WC640_00035 [Candidatus Paceibacterota bacterium]